MTAEPRSAITLGIHPTSRGFGWTAFTSPLAPHDWGVVAVRRGDKNARCLAHIEHLVDRLVPETIVLEAFEKRQSKRADRILYLGRAITSFAHGRGIEVTVFTRGDVKACFREVGAVSRQQVAEAIGRHVPALAHRVPKPRKLWTSEHPRMAMFSAAALVMTHYRYLSARFLDDLKSSENGSE